VSRRGVAPVIGVCLLLAVTVVLAALVGAFAVGVSGQTDDVPKAVITANLNGNEITLTHRSGDPLNVNELTVRIFVDGQPLKYQPDVPAYGSSGFNGLSGDFHVWGTQPWRAGEMAGLDIAGSNAPLPSAGSRVTVRIYSNGGIVATAHATA
jgi:flagellin-like protein